MRILMLTYISPLQKWGSAQRSRLLIEALLRLGSVDVVALEFQPQGGDVPPLDEQSYHGARVLSLVVEYGKLDLLSRPRFDLTSSRVTQVVGRHVDLSSYDLIVSRYVKPALKLRLPRHVPVVVDFDDAVYEPPWPVLTTLKMRVGGLLRLFNDRLIVRRRLQRHQHAHYFFCREQERAEFPWLAGSVLPNLPSVALTAREPSFASPARPALMFIGLLDYLPNQDAVNWLTREVWPKVRSAVRDARLLLVGQGAPDVLQRWQQVPGVETLGFVDSLDDAYAQVTASVVPMQAGAGSNIKAAESYYYGRPVVATSRVLSGYGALFRAGRDMLVADDADEFARHCIELLQPTDKAARIAQSGYERLQAHLTKDHFSEIVRAAIAPLRRDVAPPHATQPSAIDPLHAG
jgi:polysaccharide biosynthesis protein PslH